MSISINKRFFTFEVVNARTQEVYDLVVNLPRNALNKTDLKAAIEEKVQDFAAEIFKKDIFQHAETISTNLTSSNPFDIEGRIAGFEKKLHVQTGKLYENLTFLKDTILGDSSAPHTNLPTPRLTPDSSPASISSELLHSPSLQPQIATTMDQRSAETPSMALFIPNKQDLLKTKESLHPITPLSSLNHSFVKPILDIDKPSTPTTRENTAEYEANVRITTPSSSSIDKMSYKNYLERDLVYLNEDGSDSSDNDEEAFNSMLKRNLVFFNEIDMQLYQEKRLSELFGLNPLPSKELYGLTEKGIPILPTIQDCLSLGKPQSKTSIETEFDWPQAKGWLSWMRN